MSLGVATPLSAKFFETMLSTPAWISFWRCYPHAPSLSMQLWQCSPNVPRRCPARVQRCLAGKRLCPLDCIDRGTRPSTKAHYDTAAYAQSGRVYVSIAIPGSDGGLKLLVELPFSASLLLPSLLAVLSVMTAFHAHVAAVLPANISDLSR